MKVTIHQNVLNEIHLHGDSSMRAEICGILIGTMEDGHTDIVARIEGKGATEQGANVTFTQETWEYVYKVKDEHYDDLDIVGWYHTHPGFGIFLSSYDIFIHENFFGNPGQVAWVYDPHSKDEGCFHWKEEKVVKCLAVETQHDPVGAKRERPARKTATEKDSQAETAKKTPGKARMNLVALILFPLLTLILGGTLGFVAGKGGEKEKTTGPGHTPPIPPPGPGTPPPKPGTGLADRSTLPTAIEWNNIWLDEGEASLFYRPTVKSLPPTTTIIAKDKQLLTVVRKITMLEIPYQKEYRSQEIQPSPPLQPTGLPLSNVLFWAEANPDSSMTLVSLLKVEAFIKTDERFLSEPGRYEPEADGHYRIPLNRNPAYTAPTATSPTGGESQAASATTPITIPAPRPVEPPPTPAPTTPTPPATAPPTAPDPSNLQPDPDPEEPTPAPPPPRNNPSANCLVR